MHDSTELIQHLFRLSREMIILADEGHAAARDDGCRLLFGVLQDCAYKIRQSAEREREIHRLAGTWSEAEGISKAELSSSPAQTKLMPCGYKQRSPIFSEKEELFMGCKACGKQEGLTTEQHSLLAALAAAAAPAASKELATVSGLDGKVVSCGLTALKAKGYVDSPARCRYAITATGRAALG